MGPEASTDVRETIQRLWDVGALAGLTDGQLLARFLDGPDESSEAAFATLVERHGPSVRRVCAELLGDFHGAQDAAQAAFLVLARKARSIRKPESLGSWLHGVALRVARRAGATAARRRAVENQRAEVMARQIHTKQAAMADPHLELHEEIERLPEKYKSPIVLCYFQGYTQEQAAQQLGWPLGTVQIRLHRGRERLRTRLARRGVGLFGLPAGALGLHENTAVAAKPVPLGWARATASAAVRFAAGRPAAGLVGPAVLELAEFALGTMLGDSLKALALTVLAVGIASTGVGLSALALARGREPTGVPEKARAHVVVAAGAQAEPAPPVPAPASDREPAGAPEKARAQVAIAAEAQAEPAPPAPPTAHAWPEVDAAIQAGVRFLKGKQRADGSWLDADSEARSGTTSLVALGLLAAGEARDAPAVTRAVENLRALTPEQLRSVYAVSLQTMVFAAVGPHTDKLRIAANARWLQDAQIKPGERVLWPGSWTYSSFKTRNGDNSNTQHALLGLKAASDAGVPVRPEVWILARRYWEQFQRPDGGWGYTPHGDMPSSASMTCAGISSLVITGGEQSPALQRGVEWVTNHFRLDQNVPIGQQWRYYYIAGLERAGRLTGQRSIGTHDWYREGAEKLLQEQDREQGFWQGAGPVEGQEPLGLVATSFALMFLGHGRASVPIAPR
jgi:RNA polymerase sigma factor (sigma-70 family)